MPRSGISFPNVTTPPCEILRINLVECWLTVQKDWDIIRSFSFGMVLDTRRTSQTRVDWPETVNPDYESFQKLFASQCWPFRQEILGGAQRT